ncbi:hypothetical protein KP79_PYT19652 [Mizuhopecten yessoensis]|uniref:Uncharacterized protein n=1 Tax=Mizuhopecten yessoensis TaxID=6573 RepID=A0A210QIR7_MIZYE|nr:hypothetical protein KP79_PYT19652 [Mizuhopecten yessoensis]
MHTLLSLIVVMVAVVLTEARSMPFQPNMNNAARPNAQQPTRDFWPGPGALPRMPRNMPNSMIMPPFMNFRPGMNGRLPFVMPGKQQQKGMFGGNSMLPMMFATNMIDEDMLPFMMMAGM